jgi:mannitol/fructose-specific phosphotransferase system IIA component (Ntr-type)
LLRERYDEKYAMMNIKPHISGYFSGLLNKKETVKKIVMCESYKTIIEIINNFFENYSSL